MSAALGERGDALPQHAERRVDPDGFRGSSARRLGHLELLRPGRIPGSRPLTFVSVTPSIHSRAYLAIRPFISFARLKEACNQNIRVWSIQSDTGGERLDCVPVHYVNVVAYTVGRPDIGRERGLNQRRVEA